VYHVRWTRALVSAVVREWVAQINAVRKHGLAISHVDSHHHVHTLPGLFFALKRVQRECGIRRVRGTWSIHDREHLPGTLRSASKRAWLWALRHIYSTTVADEFCDFLMFRRAIEQGVFAPRVWPRVIELMVHPNGPDTDPAEPVALRSGWMERLDVPTKLVPYTALG